MLRGPQSQHYHKEHGQEGWKIEGGLGEWFEQNSSDSDEYPQRRNTWALHTTRELLTTLN
jgi:hypothetical protein